MEKIKFIKRQDSGLKLSAGNSGETSLNLSNEIFDFLSHNAMSLGEEKQLTFKIYREDYLKALSFIILKIPLYKSSSNSSEIINDIVATFQGLYNEISTYFGDSAIVDYQVTLFYRPDGRIYLKGLRRNNFSIRDYLVENNSAIKFTDENDNLNLRVLSNVTEQNFGTDKHNDDLFAVSLLQTDNTFSKPLLTALRTKPFVLLAGISGTGKSRIVRELAFKSCPAELQDANHTTPGNYCMIEVKPNWHDSTELLGYYSNISGKYMFTDFAKFLVKAMQHPDVPFFVCLDEMNLAPVEQYFAEFLSVLETRKMVDGHIVTGALVKSEWFTRKYEGGFDPFTEVGLEKIARTVSQNETDLFAQHTEASNEPYERQDIVDYLKEKGLTLPDNVFVIGTVNMDDTTHQFSRKVIDRAMTIEMNGGDLGAMFGGSAALNYLPEDKRWKIEFFRPRYVNADEVLAAHPDCAEQIKAESVEKIKSINTMLENTPFVVSYRVLNELVIYLGNLLDAAQYQGDGTDEIFVAKVQEAFDAITLMKILPRVEGDDELFDMKNDTQNRLQKMQELFTAENSGSHRKLQEMDNRLEQMQFTRFWP